jgi:hypothetical protein
VRAGNLRAGSLIVLLEALAIARKKGMKKRGRRWPGDPKGRRRRLVPCPYWH